MREVRDSQLWWMMDGVNKKTRKINSLITYYKVRKNPVKSDQCLTEANEFLAKNFKNKMKMKKYLETVLGIEVDHFVMESFWNIIQQDD